MRRTVPHLLLALTVWMGAPTPVLAQESASGNRRAGNDEASTIAHAIAIRKTPEACEVGYHCYYRDVHHDRVLPALDGKT